MTSLANHLWQSTFFVCAAWLLALALKRNRAAVRYWVWLAASMKFLIPFSWLVKAGSRFGWRTDSVIAHPQISFVMEEIGRPFAAPMPTHAVTFTPAPNYLPAILCGVWFCGFAITLFFWFRSWLGVRRTLHAARYLPLNLPIPAVSSTSRMEPGVFGIFRPVLLLPEGIADRLAPVQLNTIIAHELCHVRRRDNLAGAVHMLVEAIFWFHPLVWWIEARLMEERERACDEDVLRSHGDPESYAEGILQVCRFCMESPTICVAGVTGANLRKRIEEITANRLAENLSAARKALLAGVGLAAILAPVGIGFLNASASRAQSQSPVGSSPAFEVASVKPTDPTYVGQQIQMPVNDSTVTIRGMTLKTLIQFAYCPRPGLLPPNMVTGGPSWYERERFDITAKAEGPPAPTNEEKKKMLAALLGERFGLKIHRESKESTVIALVVAKNGAKIKVSESDDGTRPSIVLNGRSISGRNASMDELAMVLQPMLALMDPLQAEYCRAVGPDCRPESIPTLPLIDKSGLAGKYDFELRWESDIYVAIQDQLGLKLQTVKAPVDFFVVDRAERPSVAELQSAPARLEFDVASVKANHSGRSGTDGFKVSHGSLTVGTVSLKALVEEAYGIQGAQIIGGPAWLSSDRYDVVAKGSADATNQQVLLMLRSLLTDRFQLTVTNATKELPIYELEAGSNRSKLLKRNDSDCVTTPDGSHRPDVHPCGGLARVCGPPGCYMGGQRVPISAIADALSGFVDRSVVDRTGLTGAFDVELWWTPDGYAPPVGGGGEERPQADATESAPAIFPALQEQLGLKLVAAKGTAPVLVIDHAERPSGN